MSIYEKTQNIIDCELKNQNERIIRESLTEEHLKYLQIAKTAGVSSVPKDMMIGAGEFEKIFITISDGELIGLAELNVR